MKHSAAFLVAFMVIGWMTVNAPAEGVKGGRLCPQSLAVYGASDQAIILEFAGSADGAFRVLLGNGGAVLEGFVYPGEDDGDNLAVMLNDCPDGDATGEEIAACTIWQGPIAAMTDDGGVAPLPASDQPAAGSVLFDGLTDALIASEIYKMAGLSARDFDTLTLLACQE